MSLTLHSTFVSWRFASKIFVLLQGLSQAASQVNNHAQNDNCSNCQYQTSEFLVQNRSNDLRSDMAPAGRSEQNLSSSDRRPPDGAPEISDTVTRPQTNNAQLQLYDSITELKVSH